MKTSNKFDMFFRLISLLFSLCYFIIQIFRISNFGGEWYFTASTIVYSIGIILGIVFLIMYLFLFRKYKGNL